MNGLYGIIDQLHTSKINQSLLIMGCIVLLGAALRIYNLGEKSLWLDEAKLFWISQGNLHDYHKPLGNFKELIEQNAKYNSAAPTYAILVRFISKLGDSEAILRSISCLAGIASIVCIYFLSTKFLERKSAYFTSLLVAVAPYQVYYSQQLGEYSLTFLFATLIILLFYVFLTKPNRRNIILLSFTFIVSIMIQYGLALLILAFNFIMLVCILLKLVNKRILIKWAIPNIFSLIVVLVVYYLSLRYQFHERGFASSSYLSSAYWDGNLNSLFGFFITQTRKLFIFAYPSLEIILFLVFLGLFVTVINRYSWILLMIFIFPLLIVFILSCLQLFPYSGSRQVIFLTPAIYLIAGYGFNYLSALDKKCVVTILLFLILGITGIKGTYEYHSSQGKENIKPIINKLESLYEAGDKIYIYRDAIFAFRYYFKEHKDRWIKGIYTGDRDQSDKYLLELDEILAKPVYMQRLWMVYAHYEKNETKIMKNHVSKRHEIKRIIRRSGAELYLVR